MQKHEHDEPRFFMSLRMYIRSNIQTTAIGLAYTRVEMDNAVDEALDAIARNLADEITK